MIKEAWTRFYEACRKMIVRLSALWRLHRICTALEIRPEPWQREFALGDTNVLPKGRANGKTTAVLLRLLMAPADTSDSTVRRIVELDPDWRPDDANRCRYFTGMYMHMAAICSEVGIKVVNPVWSLRRQNSMDYWRSRMESQQR